MARGFVSLPVVIAVVLGLGFAASVYLNYAQHEHTISEEALLNGQITDLTYQVKQDRLNASPSPSPSVSPTTTPASTPTPSPAAVLGAAAKTATIKAQGNIHLTSDPHSKILLAYTSVPVGAQVTLTGGANGLYQQITINGVTGYIETGDLQQ